MRIRNLGWKKFGTGMEKSRIRDKHPGSATLLKIKGQRAYLRILLLLVRSAQHAVNARHGRNGAAIGTATEVCCLPAGGRAARATASPPTTCAAWRAGRGGRRRRRRPPARRRWPGGTGRTNHMSSSSHFFFLRLLDPQPMIRMDLYGIILPDPHGSVPIILPDQHGSVSSCRIRMDPYHLAGSK